jgi:hypothetical protein
MRACVMMRQFPERSARFRNTANELTEQRDTVRRVYRCLAVHTVQRVETSLAVEIPELHLRTFESYKILSLEIFN